MQKFIPALCAALLACAAGAASAANNDSSERTGANGTTGVVTGDQGVVSPSDTTNGVGTTGLDQETRASQNTQEGVNTGTRQIPDNKHKSH
jgi:hypothetical protein